MELVHNVNLRHTDALQSSVERHRLHRLLQRSVSSCGTEISKKLFEFR